jgi:iron(III) transport system substrate-binding protein
MGRLRGCRCRRSVASEARSTPEAQQLIIDHGGMRSEHLQTKEKPGRKPFREIKVMKEDAVSVERMSEEIKARYTKIFGV